MFDVSLHQFLKATRRRYSLVRNANDMRTLRARNN